MVGAFSRGSKPVGHSLTDYVGRIGPRLVELWLALVLLFFFLIRIWGSHTGKHILQVLGLG